MRAEDRAAHVAHLRSFCHAVHTAPVVCSRRLDLLALPNSLLRQEPFVIARDAIPAMGALLATVTVAHDFDAVHADQTAMVQYALAAADQLTRRTSRRPRLVLDAHNALYKVLERLTQQERRPGVRPCQKISILYSGTLGSRADRNADTLLHAGAPGTLPQWKHNQQ